MYMYNQDKYHLKDIRIMLGKSFKKLKEFFYH